MTKLAIAYRKNPAYIEGQSAAARLFASIDLHQFGADDRVTDLPIHFRNLEQSVGPVRVIYSTRVAGLTIERGNLKSLADVIKTFLTALIRFDRLPHYMFNVAGRAWPIYELTGQVVTRYPGGPVFRATTIADLWIALADHFKQISRIASRRDLAILCLSPADLQLYAPDFTLRSSALADIPVFATWSGQRGQLLAPLNGHALGVAFNGGSEIIELSRQVGNYLATHGRLADPWDLSIRRLAVQRWADARQCLRASGQALLYYTEVGHRLARQQANH